MKTLKESILTESILKESILKESILSKVGGGDRYFDEQLKKWGLDPRKTTWNKDGSIDYDGDVMLMFKGLTKLPFKFRNVNGAFYCNNNHLTTLDGCPETISGDFSCSTNDLVNLKGGPKQVGGAFLCHNNELTSLEGLPKKLDGKLYCFENPVGFTIEYILKLCKVNKNRIHN